MVCLVVAKEPRSVSLDDDSTSSNSHKSAPAIAGDQEMLNKKRRLLLLQSAKAPSKRKEIIARLREEEKRAMAATAMMEPKKEIVRRSSILRLRHPKKQRRAVYFEANNNQVISVQSHKDYSQEEYNSYYFQKEEYAAIKKDIQRTIDFFKSPNDGCAKNRATSSSEEHCIRGIESLVEDFVNNHKKRIQKQSKIAVFKFQKKLARKRRRDEERTGPQTERYEEQMVRALADVYKRCTSDCEHIARRWGHFDAVDAGIEVASESFSTELVSEDSNESSSTKMNTQMDSREGSISSLSSISCDGEGKAQISPAGNVNSDFDSLQNVLFNY